MWLERPGGGNVIAGLVLVGLAARPPEAAWLGAGAYRCGVPCKQGNGWLRVVDSVADAAQGWRCHED